MEKIAFDEDVKKCKQLIHDYENVEFEPFVIYTISPTDNHSDLVKLLCKYTFEWGKSVMIDIDDIHLDNSGLLCTSFEEKHKRYPDIPILILLACQRTNKRKPIKKFMNSPIFDRNLFRILDDLSRPIEE